MRASLRRIRVIRGSMEALFVPAKVAHPSPSGRQRWDTIDQIPQTTAPSTTAKHPTATTPAATFGARRTSSPPVTVPDVTVPDVTDPDVTDPDVTVRPYQARSPTANSAGSPAPANNPMTTTRHSAPRLIHVSMACL